MKYIMRRSIVGIYKVYFEELIMNGILKYGLKFWYTR